jgi:hypothetical protein
MKKLILPFLVLILAFSTAFNFHQQQSDLSGAWHRKTGTVEEVLIFQDGYFSHTQYDQKARKFIQTTGGTYNTHGAHLHVATEFHSMTKEKVGQAAEYAVAISADKLSTNINGSSADFTRLDYGKGGLAGNWRISGRMNNGQMQPVPRAARKTLKLLSGTRFQWMAINTETKEFLGTGGGRYTFENGKYTEHIEFFSRDSSRVGASLSFDGSLNGSVWTHKGMNSRGEPLHEEWSRELKQ